MEWRDRDWKRRFRSELYLPRARFPCQILCRVSSRVIAKNAAERSPLSLSQIVIARDLARLWELFLAGEIASDVAAEQALIYITRLSIYKLAQVFT